MLSFYTARGNNNQTLAWTPSAPVSQDEHFGIHDYPSLLLLEVLFNIHPALVSADENSAPLDLQLWSQLNQMFLNILPAESY